MTNLKNKEMKKVIDQTVKLSSNHFIVANKKIKNILLKYNEKWTKDECLVDYDVMSSSDVDLYEALFLARESANNIQTSLRLF